MCAHVYVDVNKYVCMMGVNNMDDKYGLHTCTNIAH